MYRRLIAPGALAAALMLAIPASAADFRPGAPGIGDPYYPTYGNGGYDVSHYDLRLKYRPTTGLLEGTATILATSTQDLSRFDLDFGLTASEVRVNGKKATFAASGVQELEVTPAAGLPKGTPFTVVVKYAGKPADVQLWGFTSPQRTPDGIVFANEPEEAAWWFPSNDHPLDKATYDVSVAVPDGTQAISNGTLQSQVPQAGGWTRFNWRSAHPQATYLATLAIGKFDITTDKTADGLPVINAYSKDLGANEGAAKASVERTTEVAEWLESVYGKYPFEALGGYVPNVPSHFALETQTRPFYSPAQFANGSNVSVVVHELAHQWYGDSVSVRGWKDIWINEGFARYSQWLWSEKEGEGTAQELADYAYAQHPADDAFWTVKPGDPGAENQFASAVYDRGAMAIQALRNAVGDKKFFAILKGWPQAHAYGNAQVSDFVSYAEKISGKQLDSLFDTWLYQPERPATTALRSAAVAAPQQPRSWKAIAATNGVHAER
ncbi:M1 family metallopeptidase [Streptomyces sp. VRA16 Mangrove soil]|uniref:M1 family metallopeptidase n=1 Tax=Streptomyces sp. VRA16 Mangrove soil TaxID=2817434 RepID=UPI001A9DBB8C|nr:M1 family metallopeptidase [Streptomyces sp. VRA16 Mangrove soil]MBO1329672.1 M1 family metallopeptidase [Streptomyces sp. VRA16 Mangrove soil]